MTALLYTRVSTDEQAFGFSLTDQDKRLTEYCEKKGIQIAQKFQDDYTGKTFNRPDFQNMLSFLKKNKVDEIIFTKWTRFSRDTTDALVMIRDLKNKGITVQAIDEPIDFYNPFHKHMLNMCLTSGEVDNDMRIDNTIRGMRRSIREGRYPSRAPQGYLNRRDEHNKPILAIDSVRAPLVMEMFKMMATGEHTQQEVRRLMFKKGLTFCRTKFTDALKNVTYIGKLNLPGYKGEPQEIIKGIHEPIISDNLFYRVQDVLNGKKRPKNYSVLSEEMPLRGFLFCTNDHKMTGSCSKGHGGSYHYYHCANRNCERHRASVVNEGYIRQLEQYQIKSRWPEALDRITAHILKPDTQSAAQLQQQITVQEKRLQSLQDKFIDGKITSQDYQQIKTRYESALFESRNKLSEISMTESQLSVNFSNATKLMTNLADIYRNCDVKKKQMMIGSITPEKLYYQNGKVRTSNINSAILLIATIDKGFSESHVLHKVQYEDNVPHGAPNGAIVRTLQTDLASLSRLYKLVA